MKCLRCGKIVDENCTVCPNCGFQIGKNNSNDISHSSEWSDYEKSSFCAYCGTHLEEKDSFCPKCGRKKMNQMVEIGIKPKQLRLIFTGRARHGGLSP